MSKSLQKGILFAVCILLVCALGVTLFLADGTGMVPSVQEGQASAVAQNTATYTHGSNIGRPLPSDYTSVSDGTQLKDAIEANNKDIVLTNDVTLKTINPFWANNYLWNDNSQCFDSDRNGNTDLKVNGFTHKIYGQGYTIEVQGPHAATGEGMQQNSNTTYDYGGLFPKLGNNGAVYDARIYITKGFSGQTQEAHDDVLSSYNPWLNVGGIAGSLIGNAVIDNVTVEIARGVKLASYKWSDGNNRTKQYVRVGAIAGEINNTASISNVTVINNGRLESGQYISEAKFSPDSDRYYGAAGNVVGWISNATTSINNVRVEGSGTLYSYYVANIANAIGSTVSVNNFYNNFTGTFDAKYKYSNTLGQGEGSNSTLTVTNHYKKGALASTAGTDNTVGATNTLTVPNNLTLYFIPNATQDSNRLGIAFSGTTYSSANDYTVTGLNNAEKTASGGFSAAPSGGTLALGLPVGANNWKTDGTFASITATPKFNPSSYAKLTKYDHGYVASDTTSSGTKITQDNFASYFQPGGQANNQSGTYYLTEDVVVTGFTGINFSGTFDGNGHTIFITGANTGMTGQHIGGIVGTLTGTIKNVRVVLVNSVTANTSVSNANVGLVAGHINGGSLINVSVDIPADVTLTHTDSGNDSSLGGIAGSAVSGATFTNVTMNFNGTLSNIKTSGAGGGYWPFTSAFVGKPSVSQGTNSPANSATFNNIIIRGNGTFASQSSADDEPPYYAAIGIIQHKGVTNSTAAVYNVNGLIYDFNPQFADNQGATSGNHGACYGLFVNNNNNNPGQVQYYDSLVNYGSNGVYNASGKVIEAYAFNEKGNAPVPNPDNIKNITETVTGVTGSTVKAYFMPGDSASENLTLVASASNWNGVTQLQLDGAAPAVTSADDGSNKVVNVAKSTAVSISGENLTLSPYNPYTVITASLVTDTKVYDGNPFKAQVSFAVGGSPLEGLTAGDDYNITYTDGNATGETNANASGGTYSLTVALTGTASDGTQYVFDAQGTKTKTFTYTITPIEVTGTWSVNGLKISYGDSDSTLDASHIVINLTDDSIPGGLTERYIVAKGFNSNYVQGTTQAGETVTISEVDFDITEDNGIIADNYTLNITAGENTVEVQKKEITITAADSDPAVGHIVAIYGGENYVNSQDSLAEMLTWENIGTYVEGVYGTDTITFSITAVAHEQTGEEATYAPGEAVQEGEWAKLPAKDTYYITVTSTNDNYTVAENNYFKYQVTPAELFVTGVVWDDTELDTITYDGQTHTAKLQVAGLVGEDTYDSALTVSLTLNSGAVENCVNAGTYTVNVDVNEEDKYYDLGLTGDSDELTLAISPIKLTPTDISGTFTEYTSSNLPTGTDFVTSGILESDSEVTVAVTWGSNAPADSVVGNGNYVAANTYTASLAIQGDTNGNYALSAETANFTIEAYNLANATITVEAAGLVYDGTEKTANVTVTAGEADITDLVTITGNKATNAGDSYTVSISSKDSNTTGLQTAGTRWSIAKADYNMVGVTFTDSTIPYDGESHTLTVSEDSLPTGEDDIQVTVTYSAESGDVYITNVGSVKITATFATTSTNYNTPAAKTATLTIVKKAVTIEWSIGDIIQGTDPDKVKATAEVTNNGGILDGDEYTFTVTLPLKDGSGDYTTTTLAGTVINVTPSLEFTDPTDAGNYNITYNPEILEWTVQQPEVAISVTAPTVEKTYAAGFVTEDDFLSNFTGIFTATNADADLTSANFDITITKQGEGEPTAVGVGRLDVGTYTVTISAAADSQYTIATDSTFTYTYTVTAEQWTATVAAPGDGLTYNGLDQFSSLVITPGTNNSCDGAPIIAAVVADGEMKNAGTYTVTLQLKTAEGEAYEGGNFVLNSGSEDYSAQIEIAKLKVKIEWEANGDLVYNGQAHTLTATITNKVETDNVTAIVEKHSGDNINVAEGGFAFTITGLENNELGNYTIDGAENLTSQAFYISPATLTVEENVTFKFNEVVVGELLSTIGSQVVTGAMNNDELANIVTMTVPEGISTVTWKGVEYYSASNIGSTMTVTIISDNYTFADSAKEAKVTLSIGKLDDTITISETKTAYYYDVYKRDEATGSDNFFTVSTVSGLPVQITYYNGGDGSSPYDSLNSGDYISFDVTSTNIAVINITPTEDELSVNFNITPQRVTYTVAARPVNVAIDLTDVNPTYTGTAFSIPNEAVTVTDSDGTPSHADVSGQILVLMQGASDAEGANAVVNAGAYTVSAKSESSNVVINDTTFEGDVNTVTIAPAAIDVTLAKTEFTYGDTIDLGATVTAIEGTDDVIGVQIKNIVMDGAEDTSATVTNFLNAGAGTYFVTFELTGDDAANYELSATSNPATVTINRKQVTITWAGVDGASDNFTYTYDGTAKAPTASVTEGAVAPDTFADINDWATIDGALTDDQAINAGSYTATITKVAFEAAYPNYTIAEDSAREFTIDPATISVSLSASGDNVENNTITLNVSGRVTASAFTSGEATLTEGENTVTITAAAADGATLPDIFFTLNGEPYLGTHYGTKVEGGKLSVATANTNYKITVTQPLTLNITPSIVVQVKEDALKTAEYNYSKTYSADDFTGYFEVVGSDGSPVTGGSREVTITNEEGGSVVQIKNAGTYTITYTYTPADWSGSDEDKPSTSYTFTITPATVTSVVLAEDEPSTYTFGDLRTDSTISVTVTYSDSTTQTLNATFETVSASGNYVSAGQEVTLTLTGDDNKNANYMSIGEGGLPQHQVEIRVEKRGITASISYMGAQMVDNILTIEYAGDEVQANISVTLNGMIVGVETSAVVTTQIGNANIYKPELFLQGSYANNYTITNTGDLSVVVTPKEITVEWSDFDGFTYDGTAKTPTATAKGTFDSDEVTLTVTVTGETTEGQAINAGDYTATVAAFEQGNYKLSAASEQPFSIAKATATLGIENYQGSVEYNGSAVTVTPTVNGAASSEGIVNVTIAYTADGSEAVTVGEIRNAGSYTVTLQISGALNYADASEEFVITVTPAELTVTTANTSFTYGDNIDLGASVTTLGDDVVTVAIESVTVDNEAAELKNVGTYTVTYKLDGEDSGNYSIAEGRSVTVTITAKELNIIWSEETFTYNGSAQAPTFEVNWVQGDELELTAAITGNVTDGEAINAGDYTATIAAFTQGNYTLASASTKTFTIGKANLTLTPASVTFSEKDAGSLAAYSEDSYEATIKDKVTVTGVADVVITEYTVTTKATFTEGLLGVGAHTFTITAGDNYNTATFTVTVTEQQTITITATPSSGTYTGEEITFEYAPSDLSVDISGLTITVATVNGSADGAVLNAGSYTVTFTVNSDDADYLYVVRDWTGTIAAAEVTVTEATLSAIYGEVYTAEATGVAVQNVNGWSVATFNGTPVQATVAIDQTAAAAALPGETIYLSASETAYNVIITLTSDNFKFADTVSVSGNSKQMATTLTVEKKELDVTTPTDLESLTYTSEGVVIEIADISEDIVGSDDVTVTIMVDGEPYEPGVTVLSAGEHTITYAISGNDNYEIAANSAVGQTFTIAPKAASDSITVSGETVESGGTVEITTGENLRVDTAINNYIAQNGVAEGEYTVTATDSQGNEVDIDRVSSWAPGDYTISVNLGENFSGGEMTFTISVAAGTTTEIPDPPTTPSTPIVDDGGSGNNWLFPLIIAIECVIALALIAAIVITAIKRSKNA